MRPAGFVRGAQRNVLRCAGLVLAVAAARCSAADAADIVTVRRGTVTVIQTLSGTLRPAHALTYRSPLGTRETEILFLIEEGVHVETGAVLARLDTSDVERELDRARQEARQAQVEWQAAEIEVQAARASLTALSGGAGTLSVNEAQTRTQASQRLVERLQADVEALRPLLDRGFITREEFRRSSDALEQATAQLALDRQRMAIVEDGRPHEQQRLELVIAQKTAQCENIRSRLEELAARQRLLGEQVAGGVLSARQPGLVVHEESISANPRRKVRVGDRVTASQGIVTIPEVSNMIVEATAVESDLDRLQPGQAAEIRLEARPGLELKGRVLRIGTLARSFEGLAPGEKRFDVLVAVETTQGDVKPEMTARVDIAVGVIANALLVPVQAVVARSGGTFCKPIVDGRWRAVKIGRSTPEWAEVLSGLSEGDRLLVDDATDLPRTAGPVGASGPVEAPRVGKSPVR
jgi:multidrug resistance efflux pump